MAASNKYLLPGMLPRTISPRVRIHIPLLSDEEDEEELLLKPYSVRRSSTNTNRSLDSLRADAEMVQLIQSQREELQRASEPSASSSAFSFVPKPMKEIIPILPIRLIQFAPEWAIFSLLKSIGATRIIIDNACFPYALGLPCPVLIYNGTILNGRNAILEFLNNTLHPHKETSFDFAHSTMACFIEVNCNLPLETLHSLTEPHLRRNNILFPWGLKWLSSWLFNSSFFFSSSSSSSALTLFHSKSSRDDVIERLKQSYIFLSSLLSLDSKASASSAASTPSMASTGYPQITPINTQNQAYSASMAPQQADFSLSDALLYGHLADMLLLDSPSEALPLSQLVKEQPMLVQLFQSQSKLLFSDLNRVRKALESKF